MSEIIPYVPNLTDTPENPSLGDCYYNLKQDKYYVYDGSQWIEPSIGESQQWQLSYLLSGESDYTVEIYSTYEDLLSALNRDLTATDVTIEEVGPVCVRTLSTGNNKGDWGLIKLKINNTLVPIGRIAPKIVFINWPHPEWGTLLKEYHVLNGVTCNNQDLEKVYFDNVLVYTDETFSGYILTYTNENDETKIKKFVTDNDLLSFLHTTNTRFKTVSIIEKEG